MFDGFKTNVVANLVRAESDSVVAERVRRLQESAARRLPSVYLEDRERILRDRVEADAFISGLATERAQSVGKRVRQERLLAGISQSELADVTGIHRPNIARIESGKHTPALPTLQRVADALGVSVTSLIVDRKASDTSESVA